ncbi:hypothetical protein BDV12DRAFT_169011 [Aspergillus spectabilis]
MKLQSLALALAACLSSAFAQGMPGLPSCAQECATGAIPEQCSLIDVGCICASRSFVDDMACCVGQSCEPEDQNAALDFANGICGGAGITDLPQSATCAGDSTTTSTVTETTTTTVEDETTNTTTAESTETATTTTEGEEAPTETSSETTTATETSTHTQSHTETHTETPTSSETSGQPEETDGAALLRGKEVGVLAGIVAGLAFLM